MKRRLFTILSGLSLLLCLATVALWITSYWWGEYLSRLIITSPDKKQAHAIFVFSRVGGIEVTSRKTVLPSDGLTSVGGAHDWQLHISQVTDGQASFARQRRPALGFAIRNKTDSFPARTIVYRGIEFPHWFLALLFAILPAFHLRAIRRDRKRTHAGLCRQCGYDLRATPDRCPECGTISEDSPSSTPVTTK